MRAAMSSLAREAYEPFAISRYAARLEPGQRDTFAHYALLCSTAKVAAFIHRQLTRMELGHVPEASPKVWR